MEVVPFAASAPFIAMIVRFIDNSYKLPPRWVQPVNVLLAVLWGIVLLFSSAWSGNLAEFIVTAVTVGLAGTGVQQAYGAITRNV